MGFYHFCKYAWITLLFKIKKHLSKLFSFIEDPSILYYAAQQGISTYNIINPNNNKFLAELSKLNIDLIINQSQNIIKKELLNIPKLGIINRHNALLPKNRGRLTPFWVLYNGDHETGVSIHFINEGIDSGDIIVQEKFPVCKKDNFNSIVKKNYEIVPKAMIKAIELLEKNVYQLLPNDDKKATYNSLPTLKQALKFRIKQTMKYFL